MHSVHFQAGVPLPKRQSKSTCTSLEQNEQRWTKHIKVINAYLGIALQDLRAKLLSLKPRASRRGWSMLYKSASSKFSRKSWEHLKTLVQKTLATGTYCESSVHLRAFQSQCRAEYFRRDDRQGPPNNQAWTRVPDKWMCEANILCFYIGGFEGINIIQPVCKP